MRYQPALIVVVALWLSSLSYLVLTMNQGWIVSFDPQLQLLNGYASAQQLIEQLHRSVRTQALPVLQRQHQGIVMVLWQPGCRCNQQVQPYLEQLMATQGETFVFVQGPAEQFVQTPELIPAFPAALILNSQQQLSYFGPINRGMGCTQGSSFIESILRSSPLPLGIVNLLANGCYCYPAHTVRSTSAQNSLS